MDWIEGLFDRYGKAVLGVVLGALVFIVLVALIDGRKGERREEPPQDG